MASAALSPRKLAGVPVWWPRGDGPEAYPIRTHEYENAFLIAFDRELDFVIAIVELVPKLERIHGLTL